ATLAKSCVMSAILAPQLASGSPAHMAELARGAEASGRALADAYARNADAGTIARLQHENQAKLEEIARIGSGWVETWMLTAGRAGPLLSAIVPAAGLIAIGLVLWVIPGLAVAFCFALLAQVVVVEKLSGAAALRRSV